MNTILPPLRMPVITFGDCLKGILGKKGVSASELARMMAYKSRNSIFRILEEEGGHSARQAFFDRLMDENPLELNEEERADLQQALEISRIGTAAFFGNRAMRELLVDAPKGHAAGKIEVFAGEEDAGRVMETRVEECRELHLVMMGCCSREVFSALRELLDRKKGKGKIKITCNKCHCEIVKKT